MLPERSISSLRAVGGGRGEISEFVRRRRRRRRPAAPAASGGAAGAGVCRRWRRRPPVLGLAGLGLRAGGSVVNMFFREKHTKMLHQSEGVA